MFTNWTGPMSSQQSRTDVSEIRSPKHPLFLGITFFCLAARSESPICHGNSLCVHGGFQSWSIRFLATGETWRSLFFLFSPLVPTETCQLLTSPQIKIQDQMASLHLLQSWLHSAESRNPRKGLKNNHSYLTVQEQGRQAAASFCPLTLVWEIRTDAWSSKRSNNARREGRILAMRSETLPLSSLRESSRKSNTGTSVHGNPPSGGIAGCLNG